MERDSRPIREARRVVIVDRATTEAALEKLVAERERLLKVPHIRRMLDEDSPVSVERTRGRAPVIVETSSSSEQSQEAGPAPFGGLSPVQYRSPSRDDVNFPRPSYSFDADKPPSRRVSVDSVQSWSPNKSMRAALGSSQEVQRVQDVQIQISIAQEQMNRLGAVSRRVASEPQIDRNEMFFGEDVIVEPLRIVDCDGRGKSAKYRVLWSDESVTVNEASVCKHLKNGDLWKEYQNERNRRAARECRERNKSHLPGYNPF